MKNELGKKITKKYAALRAKKKAIEQIKKWRQGDKKKAKGLQKENLNLKILKTV